MKKHPKVRISLDCSIEERKLIKVLASLEDMTISDYILSLAKSKIDQVAALRSLRHKESDPQTKDNDQWNSFLEGIA